MLLKCSLLEPCATMRRGFATLLGRPHGERCPLSPHQFPPSRRAGRHISEETFLHSAAPVQCRWSRRPWSPAQMVQFRQITISVALSHYILRWLLYSNRLKETFFMKSSSKTPFNGDPSSRWVLIAPLVYGAVFLLHHHIMHHPQPWTFSVRSCFLPQPDYKCPTFQI